MSVGCVERHLLFSTHPGHLQSHQQAHGGMKTGVYLLSELTGPERAPQPHAHTHYRTKDSFLVGVECEPVVLLSRAWHINVFQPLQHRTAFQVFWFDYVDCHKEPVGEKDEVKAERIPIMWGYNTACLILSVSRRGNQLSWVCSAWTRAG